MIHHLVVWNGFIKFRYDSKLTDRSIVSLEEMVLLMQGLTSLYFIIDEKHLGVIEAFTREKIGIEISIKAIRISFPWMLCHPVAFLGCIFFIIYMAVPVSTTWKSRFLILSRWYFLICLTLGCWSCLLVASEAEITSSLKPMFVPIFAVENRD